MDPSEPQTDPLSGLGTAPDDGDPDAGPQSYLRRLKVALLNEKACPDILFYKTELVTRLREQMDDQVRRFLQSAVLFIGLIESCANIVHHARYINLSGLPVLGAARYRKLLRQPSMEQRGTDTWHQ